MAPFPDGGFRPEPTPMRHTFLLLVAASPLAAQTITTTPAGFENTRGTSSVSYPFSGTITPAGSFRYQEIHTTLVGTPMTNIVAANFRRDESTTTTATAVARTANVEFKMGHGNRDRFTPDFAANFSGGATTVFVRKPVNLVSWVGPGNGTLEPWTNRLPFDSNFTYNGTDHLVWEVNYDSMTPTGTYNSDRATGSGSLWTSRSGVNLGTGCVATGRTSAFVLTTTAYHHVGSQIARLQAYVSNAPSSSPVILSIDAVNSNLQLPFLCSTLYALPTVTLSLGASSATGGTSSLNFYTFPFNPIFLTASIYMQAVSPDPGQASNFLPLALSQGEDVLWPALSVTTPAPAAYIYNADLTAAFGNGPFFAGSVICGFER